MWTCFPFVLECATMGHGFNKFHRENDAHMHMKTRGKHWLSCITSVVMSVFKCISLKIINGTCKVGTGTNNLGSLWETSEKKEMLTS